MYSISKQIPYQIFLKILYQSEASDIVTQFLQNCYTALWILLYFFLKSWIVF